MDGTSPAVNAAQVSMVCWYGRHLSPATHLAAYGVQLTGCTLLVYVCLQVALYPYYGTFPKKYDPSLDPWRNPDVGAAKPLQDKRLSWACATCHPCKLTVLRH
jgi:hypothetical protein